MLIPSSFESSQDFKSIAALGAVDSAGMSLVYSSSCRGCPCPLWGSLYSGPIKSACNRRYIAVKLLLLSCLAEMHSSSLAHQALLPSCLDPHLLSMHAFTWYQPVFSTAEDS